MEEKRILLVEGKDDKHVVYALRSFHEIPPVFDVEALENDEQLLDAIPGKLKEPNVTRLAVVLDADEEGVGRRWDQLKNCLGRTRPPVSMPKFRLRAVRSFRFPMVRSFLVFG